MQKSKSLHSITIEGCSFNTQLQYNINTNHIGIGTSFQYQNFNKNKFCIICNELLTFKQRKYCNKCKEIIHQKQMSDHYTKLHPDRTERGSEEFKIKCSCSHQGIPIEDFDGFLKEKPYCYKFNESCREQNREKYNNECFICGKSKEENNNRKLSVHHIDMNKLQGCNDHEWSLIPLCQSCHNKSHNKLWEYRLKYLLNFK